ncbi:putative DNA modification/repair radical SAM protein [uncultured Eubacterium sp.]|uniref:putative DNA modification/repair radical SAM protein n=1 Tax=uncultured Eubacterium sp. TaxID=165185 RepID=UPI0026111D73|nr:putative DNA modification/repair radical SAM protein [uncultured Eubacterium sp.]
MKITQNMEIPEKLKILTDAAKYDVACTSSGVDRSNKGKGMGDAHACGICHTFASDGRCVSLLKILFTNECIYDCKYCINRRSNDVPRASFTPDEVCRLTMEFYRRNYIEGLFLSSGILNSPDFTMGLIYEALWKLRNEYRFFGYIHVKAIPGASPEIIEKVGFLADRMSTNLELPTKKGLQELAPNKSYKNILRPMRQIQLGTGNLIATEKEGYSLVTRSGRKTTSKFVPAGQSTQMIIGATPETDYQLMTVTEHMYKEYKMKRVFYSAFVDVNHNIDAPAPIGPNPLLREHRLYQADWLLRYYKFEVKELLNESHPNFNVVLDPKCDWAVSHLERFPVEVMRADYYTLLRVPGLGVKSAGRIVSARRYGILNFDNLKKMGVVLKRAAYFITCNGKTMFPLKMNQDFIARELAATDRKQIYAIEGDTTYKQMTLMDLEVKA